MASDSTKKGIVDAVVRSDKPKETIKNLAGMAVENGTRTRIPHIQAPPPCPAGCTVTSATLQLTQKGAAESGSRTLSLRRITEKWRQGTLNWNNRPSRVSTATDTKTVSGVGSEGRTVEFDITDDVQDFVDGVNTNWGWTVESSNGNTITFFTSDAAKHQPKITVTWSNRPEIPTDLFPGGGAVVSTAKPRLRWSFRDLGGDKTLAAVQIHINSSAAGWTVGGGFSSPVFDSGQVAASKPQYNLSSSGYGGIGSGSTVWWTVRHQDGAGLWSKWSDPQQVTYQALPSVTLNSPGSTVNDTTFPWSWTVTTQAQYQLLVLDSNDNELWNSTVLTSADTRAYTQPRGIVKKPGVTYKAVLRVWDSTSRQDLANARAFTEVTRSFTYTDVGTVAPVTDLQVEVADDLSQVEVTFSRSTVPDQIAVWLGDLEHAVVDGPEALVSGTSYRVVLHDVPPRIEHTLSVKAIVVDGSDVSKASTGNPTAEVYLDPIGVRLVDTGTSEGVTLLAEGGQEIVETDMPETSERFDPVGSEVAVQVTSMLRWFEGTVSGGVLVDFGGLAAREQRARLLAMKATPLVPKVLVWGRNAVPVYLSKVNIADDDPAIGERYRVSFAFTAAVPSPEWTLE